MLSEHYEHYKGGGQERNVSLKVPLYGFREAFDSMNEHQPAMRELHYNESTQIDGFRLTPFPVKYDSIMPFGFVLENENERVGCVFNGKLTKSSLTAIQWCSRLYLANCLRPGDTEARPEVKARRLTAVYPSFQEEETFLRQNMSSNWRVIQMGLMAR